MTLAELMKRLYVGELSNVYLGEPDDPWRMTAKNRERLTAFVNAGLTSLTSQFQLIKRNVTIQTRAHIAQYYLRKEYALTDPTPVPYKYLIDQPEYPFEGRVVKILEVYDECGAPFLINTNKHCDSVYTGEFDQLIIPDPCEMVAYTATYQASHKLLIDDAHETQPIHLPPHLYEALALYVAGQFYRNMGGAQNTAKAVEFMGTYAEICAKIEMLDQAADSEVTEHNKFEQRGFC